jgi:hypothetical protein
MATPKKYDQLLLGAHVVRLSFRLAGEVGSRQFVIVGGAEEADMSPPFLRSNIVGANGLYQRPALQRVLPRLAHVATQT